MDGGKKGDPFVSRVTSDAKISNKSLVTVKQRIATFLTAALGPVDQIHQAMTCKSTSVSPFHLGVDLVVIA